MKRKGTAFAYLILWLLLIGVVLILSGLREKKQNDTLVPQPTSQLTPAPTPLQVTQKEEMVGLWVPYMSLHNPEGTQQAFEARFAAIVAQAKEVGVNTLFVHLRPFGDALYPSSYYPWSHILTGKQGQDPGFDPLAYMLDLTHQNGMEFHGWINPLRIKLASVPDPLGEQSPYVKWAQSNPYYFLENEGTIFLNPAYKEVRNLISDGVQEIVENYAVDGIHFDDYFYPETTGEGDTQAYTAYTETTQSPLSLADWRCANVNTLVAQVYRTIKSCKETVEFGISPQGNVGNNQALGADVFSWMGVRGYVDYMMPQLYFSYENPALGFTQALESWMNLACHGELDIYIGLGLYKVGTDSDNGTWQDGAEIIRKQVTDLRQAGAKGFVLYDAVALQRVKTT